nr:hypothetical protein [Micromonospora sp. DSM 115978]
MLIPRLRFRLLMLVAAAGILAVALAIRAVAAGTLNSTGRLEQYSGTALYAFDDLRRSVVPMAEPVATGHRRARLGLVLDDGVPPTERHPR